MKRLLLLLLLVFHSIYAYSDERILDYHSDITVFGDGTMGVIELITVRVKGYAIKHGIYRDFPTDYRDAEGNRYHVSFDVVEVTLDGDKVDYRTERQINGQRIYIGNDKYFVAQGVHTYKIVYMTNRQLGFFENHDELYWNVTGNGWAFPIDLARARVHLPSEVGLDQISVEAYTGAKGEQGRSYLAQTFTDGASFITTQALDKAEGLTIVVTWPKGIVWQPTMTERVIWFLQDNSDVWVALGGMLLLLGFYMVEWKRVGRDPEPGVIIPQYDPPPGISPAAARYIMNMEYDEKCFTVALVSLAVKGYIKLRQDGENYSAESTGKSANRRDLGPGEQALLKALFRDGRSRIVKFEENNQSSIRNAINANLTALHANFEKAYFSINGGWIKKGAWITFAIIVAAAGFKSFGYEAALTIIFFCLFALILSVAGFFCLYIAYASWRDARYSGRYSTMIGMLIASFIILSGDSLIIYLLISISSPLLVILIASLIGINFLFYQLLKAPTLAGRAVMDQLEGLRLFIQVAEQDELQFNNPPDKTPELFERLFPYAIALDLEQPWAERFTDVFTNLESEQRSYNPDWYRCISFSSSGMSQFSGSLSHSLGSAVSSASSPPSVSGSGFGGGGSSGGGGGGGGGGGW